MPQRFLTLADVAEALAVSVAQVRTLVRSGELRAIQVGPKKVWRIEDTALEQYISEQYERTKARIEAEQHP
ncbi:helix-turn-helix domain-containing protein [Georgenia alba]|uniref:Helix-turn-helix domain-containing protein n=1 Tax=Georgenia alba TaxID=2233858 RepID=A0ABW2QCX8_9MICO